MTNLEQPAVPDCYAKSAGNALLRWLYPLHHFLIATGYHSHSPGRCKRRVRSLSQSRTPLRERIRWRAVTNNRILSQASGSTTIWALDNGTFNVNGGSLDIEGTLDGESGVVTLSNGNVLVNGTVSVSVANLLGGPSTARAPLPGGTVNNGDGFNDESSQGVLLNVGGSFAVGNTTQSDTYTFSAYNQDADGALGIAFNASGNGNNEFIAGNVALHGTLDLWNSTAANSTCVSSTPA